MQAGLKGEIPRLTRQSKFCFITSFPFFIYTCMRIGILSRPRKVENGREGEGEGSFINRTAERNLKKSQEKIRRKRRDAG